MDVPTRDFGAANTSFRLAGRAAVSTVMFTDIRGFSALSADMGPEATVSFLNEYFTMMVDCLRQEGGTLDKFIGDGMMAAFGSPSVHDDDEDRAVRAAIGMLRALAAWNAQRGALELPEIAVSIGINTDVVVWGAVGAPTCMDYTLIGDGVNLAARLERACRHYRTSILISDRTARGLRGSYVVRPVDEVIFAGRCAPVTAYEVLDHHTDASFPNRMAALNAYRRGFSAYQRGRFLEAIGAFSDAVAAHPADGLAALYLDRCKAFIARPPSGSWDGVWMLADK